MKKQNTRRINPVGQVTFIAVVVLIVFEVLIVCGAFELQPQTVEKHAPWAYEPFLRLIGEHPDSTPSWVPVALVEPDSNLTGLESLAIPLLLSTNVILEASIPFEVDPTPVRVSTNAPSGDAVEEFVPVG